MRPPGQRTCPSRGGGQFPLPAHLRRAEDLGAGEEILQPVQPRLHLIGQPALHLLTTGIFMNVGLGLFNLVPLPPLDGAWLASWGLPRRLAEAYDRLVEPWGATLLLLLVATGGLGRLTGPPLNYLSAALVTLAL